MTIIYILFVFIFILLLIDFKKGVLLYAPLKLFFNINVRFGITTFDFAMSTLIFILFILNRKKLYHDKFPLSKYFIIYAIGYTITCIYPDYSLNFIPRIVIMVLLFSYVYYYCLKTVDDVKFAIMSYSVFAIVMCFNGLLEPLFNINPLDSFLQSVSNTSNSIFIDNTLVRMGQVRYRSFIPHAISYGVACCIILYIVLWRFLIIKDNVKVKFITLLSICLLISGIFICGSRTPILGLLPIIFIIFNKKYINKKVRNRIICLVIIIIFIRGDYFIYTLESLLNPKVAEEAGGSSMDVRLVQFSLALNWMLENPMFGKGMQFDAFSVNTDILGAESVWFPLMMNNGLIGVFSYAVIYWGCYKKFSLSSGKLFLLLFSLGWLIMRSATSLIGVTDAQFFTCMFIIYRFYEIKKQTKCSKYDIVSCNSSLQR